MALQENLQKGTQRRGVRRRTPIKTFLLEAPSWWMNRPPLFLLSVCPLNIFVSCMHELLTRTDARRQGLAYRSGHLSIFCEPNRSLDKINFCDCSFQMKDKRAVMYVYSFYATRIIIPVCRHAHLTGYKPFINSFSSRKIAPALGRINKNFEYAKLALQVLLELSDDTLHCL